MPDDVGRGVTELSQRIYRGGFDDVLWHGPLRDHVADLTVGQALWRPAPGRHCVWEIVRHVTLWRRVVIAWYWGRERPEARALNWSRPEPADEAAWRTDVAALEESQRELEAAFQGDARPLLARNADGAYGVFSYLVGVICHDSYHTGQIAHLRALMGLPPIE